MINEYEVLVELQRLKSRWSWWADVFRGEVIVRLRKYYSLRQLARELGCSEGLIRHLEIVGRLPLACKEELLAGKYSTRRVVAEVRAQRRTTG